MAATHTNKEKILKAALEEFGRHGMAGARMQEIAREAGVNKAMIYYYYDSKDGLYFQAYQAAAEQLLGGLFTVLESEDTSLFEKVIAFTNHLSDSIQSSPESGAFLVSGLNREPELAGNALKTVINFERSVFERQLDEAADNYEIVETDVDQVLINMISLCLFPYAASNFMRRILEIDDDESWEKVLDARREIACDAVLNWLTS